MKFNQLIEYDMWNIFLEKSYIMLIAFISWHIECKCIEIICCPVCDVINFKTKSLQDF